MNRFLITFLTFVFYFTSSIDMYAAQRTWNGSLSTSWTSAGNWTPSGAPGATDTATIVSATNNPVLTANTSLNRLTITSGTINLGGYSLTVHQRIACNGGSITNGKFIVRGTVASFAGTTFGCKVEAIVAQLKLDGGFYSDSCYFEQTGGSTGNGQGGNVFNGPVTIRNSGTSTLQTAIAAVDTFNFPLSIFNSSNLSSAIVFSNGNNTVFNGNISISNSGSGQIAFGSAAGSSTSTLASGKTIAATAGAFKRGGLVLNRFTQIGSTTQAITLDSIAFINIANSQINGALTISSPAIILKSNTFNGNVEITKTGLTTNNSDGGNTFNGNLIINNTASNGSAIRMATSTGDTYNGNLTLNSSNAFIQMAYADTSILTGNCSINHVKATFNSGVGALKLSGTPSQSFSGSATYAFGKLIINKASNGVTFSQPATIDTSLRFLKGFIFTDSVNSITLRASASVNGASDSGYVDGYVKKIGNSAFIFPVGDNGHYVPIEITSPSVNTDAFLVTFIAVGQTAGNSKDYTIKFIDNCNYWKLYRTTGSSAVNVKLSWQAIGCPILDSASIIVANWNGSTWKDLGRTSFAGNRNNGTITNSSAVNSFNQFTLGYTACQLNAYIVGSGDSLKAEGLNGTPTYTYLWSTGATTSYILGSIAGATYTVTMTDASGCSDNASISRIFQKVTSGPVVNEANNSYYATWGDFDNDNDLDLFHSLFFNASNNPTGNNFLFQNNCNGNLTKVQSIPGELVTDGITGSFSKWIDFDNDSDQDLYVGPGKLYENKNDGTFSELTTEISSLPTYTSPIRDAGFADYDNDGLIDVYFGHNKIYKNDGNKDFVETTISGFSSISSSDRCDAISWADYDNDGFMDVMVTNSNNLANNYLFHNNGNGTFTSNTTNSQLIAPSQNSYGCAWGDFDNDKDLDLWLNNNSTGDKLFLNNGSGNFSTSSQNITTNGSPKQSGATFADFDNDGDLDLFVPTFSNNYLFYNDGNGNFVKDSIEIVSSDNIVESYGGMFADYDNDGDLDLFVPTGYGDPNDLFYTNLLNPLANTGHNFVKFSLKGVSTNKDAIGARVYVKANINGTSKWQMREINGNSTRGGESGGLSSSVVHFGLGNATQIDSIKLVWPASSTIQYFTNVSGNTHYQIVEAVGSLVEIEPCNADLLSNEMKVISGRVYSDNNSNCTYDTTDHPIANIYIKATPGNYYTQTNDSGYYFLKVPEGNYSVDANFVTNNWDLRTCATDSAYSINTTGVDSTDNIDFPQVMRIVPCNGTYSLTLGTQAIDPTDCPTGLKRQGPCPGYRIGYCFTIENLSTLPSDNNTQIFFPLPPNYIFNTILSPATGVTSFVNGANELFLTIAPQIAAGSLFTVCIDVTLLPIASVLPLYADYVQFGSGTNTQFFPNGNFNSCGNATACGFTTDYVNDCGNNVPFSYCILPDAHLMYNPWVGAAFDGDMMCLDGEQNMDVWCRNVTVASNTQYLIEFFVQNVNVGGGLEPELSFYIDNVSQFSTGPVIANSGWNFYQFPWCSGATTGVVECCLRQNTAGLGGNDWCFDNISMIDNAEFTDFLNNDENCACDPNGLIVEPVGCGENGNVLKNQELTYEVYFQNVGTGDAHNIYVSNKLDHDLDFTTLRIMGSSHQITAFEILPDSMMVVNFEGIELEPDSIGSFSYKISPKAGLSDGTSILNQANIYFDSNDVVVTNLVKNTLYDTPDPHALFDYSINCSNPLLAYDFTYSGSTPDNANYSWTFQNGSPSTSTDQNPDDIEFSSPGYKFVTLTVDRNGCTSIYSDTILVESFLNDTKDSVLVCHDNNEIWIDIDSVHTHYSHGDCFGACENLGRFALETQTLNFKPSIKPNPTSGSFELMVDFEKENTTETTIEIYDSFGSQVFMPYQHTYSDRLKNLYNFDSNISPGIYLIKIQNSGVQKTLKLLKM